jgi:hypothetical protein
MSAVRVRFTIRWAMVAIGLFALLAAVVSQIARMPARDRDFVVVVASLYLGLPNLVSYILPFSIKPRLKRNAVLPRIWLICLVFYLTLPFVCVLYLLLVYRSD